MLITLQDDQVIRVYADVGDVTRDIEALDAEEVLRAVFDETGEVYEIKWLKPNSQSRILGWVGNGEYTLAATGKKDVMALLALLRDARYVEPTEAKQTMVELVNRLALP